MSKIGKLAIQIPDKVEVLIDKGSVVVKGPKGSCQRIFPEIVQIKKEGGELLVSVRRKDKASRALHGTARSILANMVKGVNEGWTKQMELVGAGYRAAVDGNDLILTVGFINPVKITAPKGITLGVEKNIITIEGVDRGVVGEVAAKIRAIRPPEPYQGKGIRYKDEIIKKKPGKAAKGAEMAQG
ncbi:50S ribosomal protein L6 [Candidatus Woesebacteria bacterium]|nr:50S ribosomal protein L6 [Candidatus Woesebacteria bacterium]